MARNIQREIDNAKRNARVVELRYRGMTFDAIAKEVGLSERGAAYKAFLKGMEAIQTEKPEEARLIELRRLDRATELVMKLLDDGDVEQVERLLRIMERRAKYLKLDATTKIEHEITTWEGGDNIDRAVKELTELLAANSGTSQGTSAMAGDTSQT